MEIIKSIYDNQDELIRSILTLHCDGGIIDCDPTYSKGCFYKNIPEPEYKFDIAPIVPGVMEADARCLPFKDSSLNTIMFDPPFLATTGPSLKKGSGNIINKRFGVFPSEIELHSFYVDSIKEFYRILKGKGTLIFKCQDKVSSGKQYMTHVFIINKAEEIGFYTKDLFILEAHNRIVAKWQRNQKHARKYHSYFIVFKKSSTKVCYV
jgi:hypothetical protein